MDFYLHSETRKKHQLATVPSAMLSYFPILFSVCRLKLENVNPVGLGSWSNVKELKSLLSLVCLKCLKIKNRKASNNGIMERMTSTCCEEASQFSIHECTTYDGVLYLELRIPPKSRPGDGMWTFFERYGFLYGNGSSRPLLPSEEP